MGCGLDYAYFPCYYAFLVGDLERTQMYYDVLRSEFADRGNDPSSLKPHQLEQLSVIRDALRTGMLPARKWVSDMPTPAPAGAPVGQRQRDLVRDINDWGLAQLRALLGDESLYLYNVEHPCPPYGAVDMAFRGRDTAYPVEVKKDCGDHEIVGQIAKYDLHHRLNLHLGHYDFVRSATICRTYQPFALRELKAMGVVTVAYSGSGRSLALKAV